MSIEFQDENFTPRQFGGLPADQKSGSAMVDFLINKGIVKDAASANMILIITSLIFIAMSVYFFVYGFSLPQRSVATPQQQRELPLPQSGSELE